MEDNRITNLPKICLCHPSPPTRYLDFDRLGPQHPTDGLADAMMPGTVELCNVFAMLWATTTVRTLGTYDNAVALRSSAHRGSRT